jgi:hypothetical protein
MPHKVRKVKPHIARKVVRHNVRKVRPRAFHIGIVGYNGRPRTGYVIERFRTDAKAEGDHVTVGGYQTGDPYGKTIDHKDAKWFLLTLNKKNAPWAFAKGEPFRAISSLELLGSLLGVMLLLGGEGGQESPQGGTLSVGRLSVGGLTDNAGNRFAVARLLSTKWPLVAFVAELSAQLEAQDLLFEMSWVPREQNTEADAITNGDTGWLNPSHKLATDMSKLPFLILNELLVKGAVFYEGIEAVNTTAAAAAPYDSRTLRVRDPWD